jgi:hypothetical protein
LVNRLEVVALGTGVSDFLDEPVVQLSGKPLTVLVDSDHSLTLPVLANLSRSPYRKQQVQACTHQVAGVKPVAVDVLKQKVIYPREYAEAAGWP